MKGGVYRMLTKQTANHNDAVCFYSFTFRGQIRSNFSVSLFPLADLFVRDGCHGPFFHIEHPMTECPGRKRISKFRQYPYKPVVGIHVPQVIVHPADRHPFKQSHTRCLFHALVENPRTHLHVLHVVPLAAQGVVTFFTQACTVCHVQHEDDLFRGERADQPGEAFHKRYHVLPFVVIPFHVRFRVRSSVMFPLPRHP